MKTSTVQTILSVFFLGCAALARAEELPAYKNPALSVPDRVDDLLGRLTLEEKVSLLSGGSPFGTKEIKRLDVPALEFADGPSGVKPIGRGATVAYPVGVAQAATWNTPLLREVGAAMGRDSRSYNISVLLAPNVNIQRTPLAGRNFEALSEDPCLSGRLGVAFVQGVQSEGVGTSVKHYAGNEQERERMRGSSNIGERALREIYLRPFEMIVKDATPWTVMAAYNRVNSIYMTENRTLLRDVLKGEWGFDGVVISDWGALHTTVGPTAAGLDLEMPGPPEHFGSKLVTAVKNWQVEERAIDEATRRVLTLVVRTGRFDAAPEKSETYDRARSFSVALRAAEESIVLLKNDGALLPLHPDKLKSVAIIGPNADTAIIGGGGSSRVLPSKVVTPFEALQARLPHDVRVTHVRAVDNNEAAPMADPRMLSPTPERTARGLLAEYFANADFSGVPVKSETDTWFEKMGFGREVLMPDPRRAMSVRWQGWFWPTEDGEFEFRIWAMGKMALWADGKPLFTFDTPVDPRPKDPTAVFGNSKSARLALKRGQPITLKVEYVKGPADWPIFNFGIRVPDGQISEAVAAAKAADVAIVFVGASLTSDTEGRDRTGMELFGRQNELVEAVLAANPRTIVVLNTGAPVTLPWNDRVPVLVQAWFPGQEGSEALAKILLGETNPSGKLPVTFPRRYEDNPTYLHYSGGRDADYGEGVFVGYRYYDKKKIDPLYAFGHGLSYTQFAYANLRTTSEAAPGQPINVSVEVTNTGRVAGREVVQVYVGDDGERAVPRPTRELRAFQKVELAPGETKVLEFTLSEHDFAYYDVHQKAWVAEPGRYVIHVGSSSRDLRLERSIKLNAAK